ncbi:hypothetical protein BRE01_64380 [Brevibacillus reuszeri]|uniref:DUF2515 domain-containing protein n=1 Tax=Brevibacillus reuszeri TaxID=54915 RepID=A0A0K9YW09_9BACL|nr:DUF2515 family protein [Brevibacillus reuszeri]KNB72909.1 hypothetical protein ADS79_13855 [Brevibacillus reuszeri]MED1861726.1 DUF2515 family protein [Brevibacillus reuszeri]GED72736.1 hypothetical protein BRE01_64380 [Brevibacillus reuszeri]
MTNEPLTLHKQDLLAHIRHQTALANRNNISRTQAYLEFYQQHKEIHWALLAHLVSRNGGWNMTDLKGEWLPLLMDEHAIQPFFWFLERSNWLIFHDAYPQLLLYKEMKRTGADLTSLLGSLGVSIFMHNYWKEFLMNPDSARLTRALIVNEQQYIEQRVVQKPFTLNRIFSTYAFMTQSVLSLSQVLFPYKAHPTDRRISVTGLGVEHFPKVTERIMLGKTLYKLLFEDRFRLEKIHAFTTRIPHTGSRADYWPHLFSPRKSMQSADQSYHMRVDGQNLHEGMSKLYSPALLAVWENIDHAPADGVDWYRDEKWHTMVNEEVTDLSPIDNESYARTLHWMEYGVKWVTTLT